MTLRSALWLPIFDELADPLVVTRLAAEAEEAGWHGLFVWDHLQWRAPVVDVADPWIVLAAVAAVTERLRIGPMVTPLARRRPAKVAKETATLDRLSGGRLTLGVGLGSDRFGHEFSTTGEELDDRRRAGLLDEALAVLDAAWSGEPVHHHGEHHRIDGMAFRPRPVQEPGVPVWVAGFPGNRRPLRRAATRDGFFPVNLTGPDELAEAVAIIEKERAAAGRTMDGYDVAVELPAGTDPAPTSPPARRGGWRRSPASRRRWTRCAGCCATGHSTGHSRPAVRLSAGEPASAPTVSRARPRLRAPPGPGWRSEVFHGPPVGAAQWRHRPASPCIAPVAAREGGKRGRPRTRPGESRRARSSVAPRCGGRAGPVGTGGDDRSDPHAVALGGAMRCGSRRSLAPAARHTAHLNPYSPALSCNHSE